MVSVVLASTSPFRRAMLEQAGLRFTCERPAYEERAIPDADAEHTALTLAEGKAEAVAQHHPHAIVIGADQVGDWRGNLLGKAPNAAAARAQLQNLAGDVHRLVTGVVLIGVSPAEGGSRPVIRLLEVTTLHFRPLTDVELDAYVATGEWEGCAGSYRLDGQGVQLVSRLEGDYFNIIGLPLLPLLEALRRLGCNPLLERPA